MLKDMATLLENHDSTKKYGKAVKKSGKYLTTKILAYLS